MYRYLYKIRTNMRNKKRESEEECTKHDYLNKNGEYFDKITISHSYCFMHHLTHTIEFALLKKKKN